METPVGVAGCTTLAVAVESGLAVVAKTPPWLGPASLDGLAAAAAELAPPEPPDAPAAGADPDEPPSTPFTAAHVPVKPPGVVVVSALSTSGPGSGKMTSCVSIVVQPFARFATKMLGREEKGVLARLAAAVLLDFLVPPMVTEAQFM